MRRIREDVLAAFAMFDTRWACFRLRDAMEVLACEFGVNRHEVMFEILRSIRLVFEFQLQRG